LRIKGDIHTHAHTFIGSFCCDFYRHLFAVN
jgi:hypothetical protein